MHSPADARDSMLALLCSGWSWQGVPCQLRRVHRRSQSPQGVPPRSAARVPREAHSTIKRAFISGPSFPVWWNRTDPGPGAASGSIE
jgi:hypothetical protein